MKKIPATICAFTCGCLAALPVHGAVWKNTLGTGDWNSSDNWDVPLDSTVTAIFNNTSPSGTVTLSADSTVARLRQSGNATFPRTIQIAASATADRTLGLSGSASELIDMASTASGLDLVLSGTANANGARLRLRLDGTKPISVASTASSLVIGCEISGVGGFSKINAGTLILSGASTYTGPTTVSNGTLSVSGSIGAGSAVSVTSGATLTGTGTIAGAVTVLGGGNLSPGNNAGTMTFDGGLDLGGGGMYVWELAGNSTNNPGVNFDRIVLTGGTLSLDGGSTLGIRFIGAATAPTTNNVFWQSARSWTIIPVTGGSNPNSSRFASITNGIFSAGYFSTSVSSNGSVVLTFTPAGPVTNTVDFAAATGRAFSTGVRGQNPHRREDNPSVDAMFAISGPSLMRGPAGGLDADTYDWRVYNGGSIWGAPVWGSWITSLDFLRKCRDAGSEPLFTANMFAGGYTNGYGTWICQFDNHTNIYNPGGYGTNAVTGTAAQLAADWVRYCNILVPTYRQGQEPLIGNDSNFNATDNAENLRVYNSLKLGGNWGGRHLLLTNGEAAVPKVIWWEVGNEPEVNLTVDSTLVNQHNINDKITYRDRYRTIASAMKAVDDSILTGPCITVANNGNEWLGRVAEDTNAPMDFVGIHPYYYSVKTAWPNPTNMTTGLMGIADFLASHCYGTGLTLSDYGGATRSGTMPAGWFWAVPLVATEYNPVNWDAASEIRRSTANGLGVLEHCFRFAHPNRTTNAFPSYSGANYWAQPTSSSALTNAFEALRDYAGDRMLENPFPGPRPVPDFGPLIEPLRVYVTHQTNGANKIHVWGLNFSEYEDHSANLILTNLPFTPAAIFERNFGRRGAENSLTNSSGLGWTAQEVTADVNPSLVMLAVKKATYSILTFQEAAATNWFWDISTSIGLRGGNGTWSTNILHGNWSTSVTGENPSLGWGDGKDAIFDAALSAGGTITVTGTVSPRTVIVNKANCNFAGAGTIHLGSGGMQINASSTVTNRGSNPMLSGAGGVTVNPGLGNTVTFNCTNTYTDETIITSGRLALGSRGGIPDSARLVVSHAATFDVSAKTAGYVLEAGQTLAGNGTVNGRLTVNGTVSPGASIGRLTFSTNLTLTGTTFMDVSRSGAVLTNDAILCSRTLRYGGTLIVTNSGPDALAAGDTFTLFTALTHSGSFASVQLPPLPAGLRWETTGLSTGVLQVVVVPLFSSAHLSESNLVLSGINGVAGATYYLLSSTNLALPMSNWPRVLTNVFGAGGSFSHTLSLDIAEHQRFYRVQLED